MQAIAINHTPINHANGLYCLNDLHRAAGNESRHKPDNWLRSQQAQELIAELEKTGNPAIQENQSLNPTSQICGVKQNQRVIQVVNGGDFRGTYACRELVYAYAMWISPRFHLAVIRAFDALQAAGQAPAIPQTLPEALRLAADLAEQVRHQQARLAVAERKAAGLDLLAGRGDAYNITLVSKELKTPRKQLIAYLREKKWIGSSSPIAANAKAISTGYMLQTMSYNEQQGRYYPQALITAKGLAKLAEHYGAERQS